ncbi:MAG TPA: Gfo/Idh/MocA family oxidoreductase [Terrimesophilobacter sp.]|nr:Gfo/Idh/MocA family oxidoreductase [Terrimesophilobacter sp.]
MVRIGLLGAGFIGTRYLTALEDVRGAEVTAIFSTRIDRARTLAESRVPAAKYYDDMAELAADPDVDLVVIGLPNEAHLDAVRVVAEAGKGVICTKPLGRTGAEAREILDIVERAGVWHGYAENAVFAPNLVKMFDMLSAGAAGKPLTLRAREAHSGPHAPHFWDAETAGGGALLDMGCHMVEVARVVFGKDNPIREVFAWGTTLVHADKTTGEDTAVAILKFEGGQYATIECSWIEKGGMQLRHEVVSTEGRFVTDTMSTPVWGFVENPGGYLVEKADSETGWVFPVPEEARAYGFSQEMRHFVESFAAGTPPSENMHDGVIVNSVIDACYASIESGRWESVVDR